MLEHGHIHAVASFSSTICRATVTYASANRPYVQQHIFADFTEATTTRTNKTGSIATTILSSPVPVAQPSPTKKNNALRFPSIPAPLPHLVPDHLVNAGTHEPHQ